MSGSGRERCADIRRVRTGIATEVADIPSHGFFSAARFGSGVGGWAVDSLYVSDRENVVYEIPLGVPGKAPVF